MRRAFLIRSVQRALGHEVNVHDAAYLWTRHRWMIPFATVVFGAIVALTPVAGIEDWSTRIVIALAGVAVAVAASTEYRVLALTDDGLALLGASRIRQVATEIEKRLEADVEIVPVGGTILATDWKVGERRYTVPRHSESAMERIAAR